MSKKRWLIVPLCVVLCSQGSFAQTLTRKVLGINEMFRLADENSQSIQTYKTEKEVTDEALKAAKSQRLPDISASLSFSYLGDGYLWDRDFKNGQNIPMPHFGNNYKHLFQTLYLIYLLPHFHQLFQFPHISN